MFLVLYCFQECRQLVILALPAAALRSETIDNTLLEPRSSRTIQLLFLLLLRKSTNF